MAARKKTGQAESKPAKTVSQGRTLKDLWLDETPGDLHPAEKRLLDCAQKGVPLLCAEDRPESPDNKNIIRAELLRFIVLGGDIENPLHERGLHIKGAWIDGQLDLLGAALKGNLILNKCALNRGVQAMDATGKSLAFLDCTVGPVRADRIELSGDLQIRDGCVCKDEVIINGARIAGDLSLKGANLQAVGNSLAANRVRIGGTIWLDSGFCAAGKISIEDAKVGTGVSCRGASFNAPDQALSMKESVIGGSVDFGPAKQVVDGEGRSACHFRGSLSLQRAEIAGELVFTETQFDKGCVVNLRGTQIDGQLFWRRIRMMSRQGDNAEDFPDEQTGTGEVATMSELNLAGASCLTLNMDWESWTIPSHVRLDHFTYAGFSELPADWNIARWKEWLETQPPHHLTKRFRPHPYQQLAKILEASGFEEEARAIRIERREKQRLFTRDYEPRAPGVLPLIVRSLGNFWRWIQKIFIGHGYRPGVTVFWLLGLIAVGAVIYEMAARQGIMTPSHPLIFKEAVWTGAPKDHPPGRIPQECRKNWVHPKGELSKICPSAMASEYSTFNAVVYSLDVAIPVVNFRMEADWAPRVVHWKTGKHEPLGWWVRSWEWFQIGAGWALSLLFVSAIGGVIRRD